MVSLRINHVTATVYRYNRQFCQSCDSGECHRRTGPTSRNKQLNLECK